MKHWLVELLVCPKSGEPLTLEAGEVDGTEILSGALVAPASGHRYPILNGVARFVEQHYAASFGLQWNRHRRTQLDTARHRQSAERFWGETGFSPGSLAGATMLDVGCGTGRFSGVAADAGARVVGLDLSEAVDAAFENVGRLPNVSIVQGSIFELPFRPGTFDAVFCLGVLQHTPNPPEALRQIATMVRPGGQIGLWWYKRYWWTPFQQKYLLRPLIRRIPLERLYRLIAWSTPRLLPLSRALSRLTGRRELAEMIVPVANRDDVAGLTDEERLEWAVLDTFDWYSPAYDKPQTWQTVEQILHDAGYRTERTARRGLLGKRDGVVSSVAPVSRPSVVVIGPAPPPYHGPAINTRAILDHPDLNRRFRLLHLDIADRRSIENIGRIDLTNIRLALQHGLAFLVLLARERPDIVYVPVSQGIPGFLRDCLFMIPALATSRRLVIHLRGSYFRTFYQSQSAPVRAAIRAILARTARVIVLGERLRPIFAGLTPDERIAVVPNGLDPSPYERLRPENRTDAERSVELLFLGNLVREKGFWQTLEAFAVVARRKPEARLSLAGQFYQGADKALAKAFVRAAGIEDRVQFLGLVSGDEKVRLLLGSDVLVFPTYYPYEGHPMVVLEAMAAGLPVVTTDWAAIPETVLDGETGIVVPPRDLGALTAAIERLIADAPLRRRMGDAGLRRFREHYTVDRMASQLGDELAAAFGAV